MIWKQNNKEKNTEKNPKFSKKHRKLLKVMNRPRKKQKFSSVAFSFFVFIFIILEGNFIVLHKNFWISFLFFLSVIYNKNNKQNNIYECPIK